MNSLTEMMQVTGARWRVYDYGRSGTKVAQTVFTEAEAGKREWPHPFAGAANLIVISQLPGAPEPVLDAIAIPLHAGKFAQGATARYLLATQELALARMGLPPGRVRSHAVPYEWSPVLGEAFTAIARFQLEAQPSITEPREKALRAVEAGAASRTVAAGFSWNSDFGIPEHGLGQVVCLAETDERCRNALMALIAMACLPALVSLFNFMAHATMPHDVLSAVERRMRELRAPDGDLAWGEFLVAIAGSSDIPRMRPIVDLALERAGENAETLTRMVRYHRAFMGRCEEFDLNAVLLPASRNPGGFDVFDAYVLDMMDRDDLAARLLLKDFGKLNPAVKRRLHPLMQAAGVNVDR